MHTLWIFSIMPNSILRNLSTPIAIVCHDAGAANIIIAWLRAEAAVKPSTARNWRLLFEGPAEKIWNERGVDHGRACHSINEVLDDAQTLIAGTGWASHLEYNSIQVARQRSVPSIAVLDHWVNYRARFVRNRKETLPDEIWVTDEYAKKLAANEFEKTIVVQKSNLYLESITQEIRSYGDVNGEGSNLLYLLEPIRNTWGDDVVNGEFEALDYFVKNIDALDITGSLSIRLRPHPSDPDGKYNQWVIEQSGLNISLDESPTLAAAIAWSNIVVGCQTYGMVVALAADRNVYSSIPSWAPPCILPQEGIVRISELEEKMISA